MSPLAKPFPLSQHPAFNNNAYEKIYKKRTNEDEDFADVLAEKKQKHQHSLIKRKMSKKINFNDETTSPVSGTVIRQLGEGESLPEVRKGKNLLKT